MITRRTWIQTMTGALTAAAVRGAAAAGQQPPIGAALYTVREPLATQADQTLKRISEIGYRQVEVIRSNLAKLRPMLAQYKLVPLSCHIETGLVTGKWGSAGKRVDWNEALDSAAEAGAKYFVFPYLAPAERGQNADDYKKLADQLNAAGQRARKSGIEFCYHNHAFEFKGNKGERPIDIMLGRLDPKLVNLEVDVFWVSVAGLNPVEFIQANAGRVKLVHLKDKMRGMPAQFTENVKPEAFLEAGTGVLDLKSILKAGDAAGVRQYFVEQDRTMGDPVESLRKSYTYLTGLRAGK